jgi:hypothetical protein
MKAPSIQNHGKKTFGHVWILLPWSTHWPKISRRTFMFFMKALSTQNHGKRLHACI